MTAIEEPGMALAPTSSATLFHTDDPLTVLAVAQAMAGPLSELIRSNALTTKISGRDHVHLEGWQALGSMLGVSAHTVWSRPTDIDNGGWEARAEARTTDGRVVGAAEAMCTRGEKRGGKVFWRSAPEYALRSMAQTRAQSKALAGPLRWVMVMTGASGAPAEEMQEADVVAEMPAWAKPLRTSMVIEFVKSLGTLLSADLGEPADDPEAVANQIAKGLYAHCDDSIPQVCGELVSRLLAAMVPDADLGEHEGGDRPVPTDEAQDAERSVVDSEFDAMVPGDAGDDGTAPGADEIPGQDDTTTQED